MNNTRINALVILIVLSEVLIPIVGQDNQIQPIIGVEAGQKYTYQVTDILNFEGVPLFQGEDGREVTGELGDVFTFEVISTELSANAEIKLEIQRNSKEKISYLNKMDILDFVVFIDWEYWKELATSFNILFDETDEYFEIQIAYRDQGLIYYLITRYDLLTGVFIYQLIYVTLDNSAETTVAYIEIVEGDPLPQPDKSLITMSYSDFYRFELTQVIGYESKPLINGTDGDLFGKEGEIIEVLVINDQLTLNKEILVAAQIGNQSVAYLNRMDFLNPVQDIGFFVFTDWDYIVQLIDKLQTRLSDHHSMKYQFTNTEFIFTEEYWNATDVYYDIELRYDLDTGVLTYEAFYMENFTSSEISIIEINKINSYQVNTSASTLQPEDEFLFVVDKFESNERRPLFTSPEGNIWLFEGDIFGIVIGENRDPQKDIRSIRLLSSTQTLELNNSMTGLGEWVVYPDWEYWSKYIELIDDFVANDTRIDFSQDEDTFTFELTIQNNETNYNYSTVYEKSTGFIAQIEISYIIITNNQTLTVDVGINRYNGDRPNFSGGEITTPFRLDTTLPTTQRQEEEANGFQLTIVGITLVGLLFVIRKIRQFNSHRYPKSVF